MTARRPLIPALAILSALVLSASGCGSDSDGGSGSEASGPIKLLTYGDYTIGGIELGRTGAQARIAHLNAEGGIDGRKIELTVCDSKLDPNTLTTCLRNAIKDGVIAAVGGNSTIDAVSTPIMAQAKIPQIGFSPSSQVGIDDPDTLCIAPAGISSTAYGLADSLQRQGVTKTSYALPSGLAISDQSVPVFAEATKKLGMSGGADVQFPISISDYTPVIAKATADGVDGVALFAAGPASVGAIRQLAATPDVKYTVLGVGINQQVVGALADLPGAIPVLDYVKPVSADIPGAKLFTDDMTTYEPDDKNYGTQAVLDWLGVYAFEQIAGQLDGDITSESLSRKMFDMPELDTGGFTPTLDTTKHGLDGLGKCVVNDAVALNQIVGGQMVESGPGFVDASSNEDVQ